MPNPSVELIELLDGLEDLPSGLNLYSEPTEKIEAPAIVVRPDSPWMEPDRFCFDLEHYSAICVVTASTPGDGIALLRTLSLAIIAALVAPWDWVNVEAPLIDETTGVPFLANRVRLTYKNGGPT